MSSTEPEDSFAAVASALIDAPCAWQTPRQLALALDWPLLATNHALIDLVEEGLIEPWPDSPAGFALTLSSLAVDRLGVHLVETSALEVFRWSRDAATVRPRRAPTARELAASERHDAVLAAIADPHAADLAAAIDATDRIERRLRARMRARRPIGLADLPRPTILLTGHGLLDWDESPRREPRRLHCRECAPRKATKRAFARKRIALACRCGNGLKHGPRLDVCPACHAAPLSRSTLCLRCGRWGWDDVLHRRQAVARARARVETPAQAQARSGWGSVAMALPKKLTRRDLGPARRTPGQKARASRYLVILIAYAQGCSIRLIAEAVGLDESRVRAILEPARKSAP